MNNTFFNSQQLLCCFFYSLTKHNNTSCANDFWRKLIIVDLRSFIIKLVSETLVQMALNRAVINEPIPINSYFLIKQSFEIKPVGKIKLRMELIGITE